MTASTHTITRHAAARMRQRGYRDRDLSVVLSTATPDDNGGWFLSDRDAQREIDRRRREIADLERLRGTRFVLDGATVITVYRPAPHTGRRKTCNQEGDA